NMTTSMFTANFDIAASPENGMEPTNKVALNMCEARGCGNPHCRVVAERRDAFDLPKQDWLDHMQQPTQPVHDTPIERRVKEGQALRNGSYVQAFGEERSLESSYGWVCWSGWLWSVCFPLGAIEDMADDDDEFERLLRIVFATAGKNMFLEPVAKGAIRDWLGVPHELGDKDPRIMGAYIKNILDTQLVPCELTAFDEDGCEIVVDTETFSARFPMSPCDEIVWGHEAMWNGAVKTLVDPEWSVWFEGVDDDEMTIVVGRKVDPRM
ncbi:MAG: hypothetical protein Q4D39_02895, partial [Coriobacteriaceae bacterium]|nr:hypothetical protein [Coriobacteriaceae bacterium]